MRLRERNKWKWGEWECFKRLSCRKQDGLFKKEILSEDWLHGNDRNINECISIKW